jgi:hypothetical protein
MSVESNGGMVLTGENGIIRKNLFQCHFAITYPTRTNPGTNLSLRSDRPATNRLSYGIA